MTDLHVGQGLCPGTARLLIRPLQAAIELGAAEDVLHGALRAVHHANRHGSPDDFIAVAFPSMRMGREVMHAGHDLELIGSKASLTGLLNLDGIQKLQRRGMIEGPEIDEVHAEEGMTGAAYCRDRSVEKYTAGWIRRSLARAERRGKPLGKKVKEHGNDLKILAVRHGDTVLHIKEVLGVYAQTPLMVSTYGLSSPQTPAILPVCPDHVREADHAA